VIVELGDAFIVVIFLGQRPTRRTELVSLIQDPEDLPKQLPGCFGPVVFSRLPDHAARDASRLFLVISLPETSFVPWSC
jgi:hypothetical protein